MKITDTSQSGRGTLDAADLSRIVLGDSFLGRRRETNARNSLPHQHAECERTGRLDNFRVAAGMIPGEISGHLAPDSDVYKWVEAAACTVAGGGHPGIADRMRKVVDLIAAAQEEDGYIDTSFTGENREGRWRDLDHGHELYCGGHLIQAAVAHHRATGERVLLDVALRWADHICDRFGPRGRRGTGGHPEIEMALVELYRESGRRKYLDQAVFFIDQRGRGALNGSPYIQDHRPIREQTSMEGHAVRQLYLAAGVTDIYAETNDESLRLALDAQWKDFTGRKMAITGGAGARYSGESFGLAYELPNRTGYYETCAAIASFMWSWRLLQLTGEAGYADVMERVLYNGLLSGVALEGSKYFYTNPLEHDGELDAGSGDRGSNRRTSRHWNRTACCPPNMARLLGALPGYLYGRGDGALYVHHYTACTGTVEVDGVAIRITQRTDYPWAGEVELVVEPEREAEFTLALRIPGWVREAGLRVNGRPAGGPPAAGSYAEIRRTWSGRERVKLTLPMPVERIHAHRRVTANAGCLALMRGPLVYCLEAADHGTMDIHAIAFDPGSEPEAVYRADLLGGLVAITSRGVARREGDALYFPRDRHRRGESVEITAVPYSLWANRRPGAMRVWIPGDDA